MTINLYTADWLLPVTEAPIRDGALAIKDGLILAVGAKAKVLSELADQHYHTHHFPNAALMPGLVNVHTHLELTVMRSFLEGLDFISWIRTLTMFRGRLNSEQIKASAIWGAYEAAQSGITTVADTGATAATLDGLMAQGLRGIFYQEVFGPDESQAEQNVAELQKRVEQLSNQVAKSGTKQITIGVSPHAPYSVAAKLFRLTANYALKESLPIAIHAAESQIEVDLVQNGQGPFAEMLAKRNIPFSPANSSVLNYLAKLGVLAARPLIIHAIQVTEEDLRLITDHDVKIAHCIKSNGKFGHGRMPLAEMLKMGIKVGLGTDSVASNNICDLFDEARVAVFVHQSATHGELFSARNMIEMMTLGGAKALGMEAEIGSLSVGKQADLIIVDLSAPHLVPVHNVEAAILYAVNGRDVLLNMVGGKEIFRKDKPPIIDVEHVRKALIAGALAINEAY